MYFYKGEAMLRQIISNPEPLNIIVVVFSYLIIFIISFPIHESAHALMAKWLGDTTAAEQGRISLNPLRHLDPMGTILMLIGGFGWAKPVPVQPYKARKVSMRAAMALTAAAGPISNVLIALVFMIIGKIFIITVPFGIETTLWLITAVQLIISINLGLAVFNLIPLLYIHFLSFVLPRPFMGVVILFYKCKCIKLLELQNLIVLYCDFERVWRKQ